MSFFKLPLEVREIIHEYALLPGITVAPLEKVAKDYVDFWRGEYKSTLSIDVSDKMYLLSVSREFAAEVLKVMARLIESTLRDLTFIDKLAMYHKENAPMHRFEIVITLQTDVARETRGGPNAMLVGFDWIKGIGEKFVNETSTKVAVPPKSGLLSICIQSTFRTWTSSHIDYTFKALHKWSGGDVLRAAMLGLDCKFEETAG